MRGRENSRSYPTPDKPKRKPQSTPELFGLAKTQAQIKKDIALALSKLEGGIPDIVDWIESYVYDWQSVTRYKGVYDYSTARLLRLQDYQKRILRHIWTQKDGKFPYEQVIWSQPKKHGKTQIAAAVGAWFAENVEPPNTIITLASNQEQSAGLVFNALIPTVYGIGGKTPNTQQSVPIIYMPNGTVIKAIPNNYSGSAGGNYGLTLWTELWTYTSERDRRLWEEMPPVPTRNTSVRWVETYAGFENESELLLDQFSRIFGTVHNGRRIPDLTETRIQEGAEPVPGLEDIQTDGRPCCWHIPKEGLFVFWDHDIRASWVSEEYIYKQKATERHATFVRLWENRWQSSEGTYITPDMWEDAVTVDGEEMTPMFLAGDASQRNDTTALVGVERRVVQLFGKEQERFRVKLVRVWDPEGKDLDLDESIAKYVKKVYDAGCLIGAFRYDPFQMHQVAVNLRKMGVPCKEFNQGQDRLKADTFLWKLFNDRRIDVYNHPVLEQHLKNAHAKEHENEQVRIVKGTASASNKVDAAVTLSMACWAASNRKTNKGKRHRTSTRNDLEV